MEDHKTVAERINSMDMQKLGNWIVTWVVEDEDDNENLIAIRRYYDAKKAAEFAVRRGRGGVRMELVKSEWNIKTQD